MTQEARYSSERASKDSWIIIDAAQRNTPVAYLLMFSRLAGIFNRQLNIARFDAADYGPREYHIFDYEVYSTKMYLPEIHTEPFVTAFMYVLQQTELERPVLLATQFGGVVRNESIRVTPHATLH